MAELVSAEQLSMSVAVDKFDPPEPRDHSKVHVSELINRAAKLTGMAPSYDDEPTQEGWNIMALGRGVEALLRPMLIHEAGKKEWLFRPQVVHTVDDIIGSLDGELHSYQGIEAIVEMKSKHSSPGDPRENWRYMAQCQAYCKMAGATVAWMPVLYLPRRGPPNAELHLYQISFSESEIEDLWLTLKNCK